MPFRFNPRVVRITLRTAHLASFGILYGGHVHGVAASSLHLPLAATVTTGAALMVVDGCRSPIWFAQLRGIATLVKVLLTGAVAVWWDHRVALLTAVVLIGGVSSHMPGRFRYWSILHGRVAGEQEAG